MAKKFFYVCAGLLALVLAAAVGYSAARAQTGGPIYYAGVGGACVTTVGRTLYFVSSSSFTPSAYPEPVPGGAEIVSMHVYNAGYTEPACTVALANGEVYHWSGAIRHWYLAGSFAGTTQAKASSWGSLKSQSR